MQEDSLKNEERVLRTTPLGKYEKLSDQEYKYKVIVLYLQSYPSKVDYLTATKTKTVEAKSNPDKNLTAQIYESQFEILQETG